MDDKIVYKHNLATAVEKGEQALFHSSYKSNRECAQAIDREISNSRYKDFHYDLKTAAKNTIDEYGADRVSWVLAGVITNSLNDGRYSSSNKAWAQEFPIPPEGTRVYLKSHPVKLDGFINRIREQMIDLELQAKKPSVRSLLDQGKKTAKDAEPVNPARKCEGLEV